MIDHYGLYRRFRAIQPQPQLLHNRGEDGWTGVALIFLAGGPIENEVIFPAQPGVVLHHYARSN